MAAFNTHVSRLELNDCIALLGSAEKDFLRAQDALNKMAGEPITQIFLNTLNQMEMHGNMLEQVVSRYIFFKANLITHEHLFPFEILSKPGEVQKILNRPKIYTPSCPIMIVNPDQSIPTAKPGYVVNMPLVLGIDAARNYEVISRILFQFENQAFSKTQEKSTVKIFNSLSLVIGANRCKSIDKSKNVAFKTFVKQYSQIANFDIDLFGFFWKPRWVTSKSSVKSKLNVPLKTVTSYFRILQRIDPVLAESIRALHENPPKNENSNKKGVVNARVPYQEIRETIKNSYFTREAVKRLRSIDQTRKIYLSIMDPDCSKYRNDGRGLFSHYNKMVQRHIGTHGLAPTVISTGYKAPDTETPKMRASIRLDQNAREAMLPFLPLAPYIPEPNMGILVQDIQETVLESFMDALLTNKESRHIINHVMVQRQPDPQTAIAFQTLGAIPTAIPERFEKNTNKGPEELTFATIGEKKTLSALRSLSQSHIFPLQGWAYNISQALSLDTTGEIKRDLNSKLTEVLGVFDPINLAYTHNIGGYTVERNFYPTMQIYEIHREAMIEVFNLLKVADPNRETFNRELQESFILRRGCDRAIQTLGRLSAYEKEDIFNLFKNRSSVLINAYRSLRNIGVSLDEANRVVGAACATGNSIFSTLMSYQ